MTLTTVVPYEQQKQVWINSGEAVKGTTGLCLQPSSAKALAEMLSYLAVVSMSLAMSEAQAVALEKPQWISLSRLNRIDHSNAADFIVRTQTGVTFGELDAELARIGQMFPLLYPAEMTLSQILAEDRPALETGARGYPRDYVLRTEIATPDGQLTYSGADVVKNVTGYDLHKLYVGSRHRYGVLTQVTLKLMARPEARQILIAETNSIETAIALVKEIQHCPVPPVVCELLQVSTGWQVLAEMTGATVWLEAALQHWKATASPLWQLFALDSLNSDVTEPNEALFAASSSIEAVRDWPTNAAVLELVTPLAEWPNILPELSSRSSGLGWRLQVRPLAGLIYIVAPVDSMTSMQEDLQSLLAKNKTGFAQWVQWPAAAYAALASGDAFWNWARTLNVPIDATQQNLLKAVKHSYDPQGVFWTPDFEF
jgi:FAD/FMN-containing dehydrogenase